MTRTLEPETRTAEDTLEVVVTLEDIVQGMRGHPYMCAVARAVMRTTGKPFACAGGFGVHVGYSPYEVTTYRTTDEMADWIRRFDRGEPVEPERFVLHRAQSASGITQGSAG